MNKGFTLVELLVVVLIIGVLSAIALPQYTTAVERSRSAEALTLMASIADSAQRYYFQHDVWPDENQWEVLDITVPASASASGPSIGKNFSFSMDTCGNDAFCIVATRNLPSDSSYVLNTTLVDNTSSDAIVMTRCCGKTQEGKGCSALEANSKPETYCNAITGAKNSDF